MKFKRSYKKQTTRLKSWDYRSKAAFFITIITKNRKNFFGHIENQRTHLSSIGQLAQEHWLDLPNHHERLSLGNFVIMPDHIHGILVLNTQIDYDSRPPHSRIGFEQDEMRSPKRMSIISPKPGSISVIVGSFKSVVSRMARKEDPSFGWTSRFHDHIIRTDEDHERIKAYIADNPKKWSHN